MKILFSLAVAVAYDQTEELSTEESLAVDSLHKKFEWPVFNWPMESEEIEWGRCSFTGLFGQVVEVEEGAEESA